MKIRLLGLISLVIVIVVLALTPVIEAIIY
jgi:hypothetical protein